MNLILWATLLASRKRDPQVSLVSLGLGVIVTGTAMSYGLRFLIPKNSSVAIPNTFLNVTQLIGWYIWCRAFWPRPQKPDEKQKPVSTFLNEN